MTHQSIRLVLACLLMATGVVASATTPVTVAENSGQRLAAIVLPREDFLAIRVPRFDAAYAEEMKEDDELIALEKTHPGISKAVTAAAHEEAEKAYGAALTLLQNDVAKLYASKFNDAELAQLITFFSSETGQAIIIMSATSSGDTATEFEASRRAKAVAMLQSLSETNKRDLAALMESGLLPKVRAINPEIAALSARRFDDVSNIIIGALPARVEATIEAYKSKPKS